MSAKLSQKQRLRIKMRHKVSIENFGYHPQALYWTSREIQEIRFQKLIEILPKGLCQPLPTASGAIEPWSLLDVGCGFADLKRYLAKRALLPEYLGIDVSPDMVRGAQSLDSSLSVYEGELADFSFAAEQFNYVMLSGALNEVVETQIEGTADQQGEYAKSVIRTLYDLCQNGVAFNLLDRRNEWLQNRIDLQSFYPQEIVNYCKTFADQVTLIDDYLDNDFTVYLYKKPMYLG